MTDTSEFIYYKDPSGNSIKFFNYKGMPVPNYLGDMKARMNKLEGFQARPDDVHICGYSKSGTNWTWEIINMLLSGKAENIKRNKMTMMFEARDVEVFDAAPSPRILNNHLLLPDLPEDILTQGSRIVYLLRNPKDVCVSHFHHISGLINVYNYEGNWTDYFQLWLNGHVDNGCWFAYVKHWEKQLKSQPDLNVHVIHYEDLKLNFVEETKQLANFLGVTHSEQFYRKVAEKCDIKTMMEAKKDCYTKAEHCLWQNKRSSFFRKGIIGDWQNYFTVSQNKQFDTVIKERLSGSDLKFIYEDPSAI